MIEVDERSFSSQVLEASHRLPVVVDFWAAWCAPCRVLGPILESLEVEAGGSFLLAKVDVDRNPALAARYGVQGIPAVKAFRDGRLVDEFVGALPEPRVREFLSGLLPHPGDEEVRRAAELEAAEARQALQEVLKEHPHQPGALLALAGLELQEGRPAEARKLLRRIPPGSPEARQSVLLEEQAELLEAAGPDGDFSRSVRQVLAGRYEEGLEGLFRLVEAGEERERARRAMLTAFRLLGQEHPLTRRYQQKLAAVLFG